MSAVVRWVEVRDGRKWEGYVGSEQVGHICTAEGVWTCDYYMAFTGSRTMRAGTLEEAKGLVERHWRSEIGEVDPRHEFEKRPGRPLDDLSYPD